MIASLGFRVKVDPLFVCFLPCCDPQIYLLCKTCWLFWGQYGSQMFLANNLQIMCPQALVGVQTHKHACMNRTVPQKSHRTFRPWVIFSLDHSNNFNNASELTRHITGVPVIPPLISYGNLLLMWSAERINPKIFAFNCLQILGVCVPAPPWGLDVIFIYLIDTILSDTQTLIPNTVIGHVMFIISIIG